MTATFHPGHMDAEVLRLVGFRHRADMGPQVPVLGPLDGQLDAAGSVPHGVAGAAVLVLPVLDVVAQQLPAGARPAHRQPLQVLPILKAVRARQREPLTGPAEQLDRTAWRTRTRTHQ